MKVDNTSLGDLDVTLVGPGRVGTSLAWWLQSAGARVVAVVARDIERARVVAEPLGARAESIDAKGPLAGSLMILGVSDTSLAAVAASLVPRCQSAAVVHLAGALGPSVLSPLHGLAALGCWHPLRAFARPEPNPALARGMVLAVDGDPLVIELARRVGEAIELDVQQVPEAVRPLYHLAASLAAGGAAAMVVAALELSTRLGLDPAVARGYIRLAHGALDELGTVPTTEAARAITGPAARGDVTLIERIDLLATTASDLAAVAALAALATLRLRAEAGLVTSGGRELEVLLLDRLGRPEFLDPSVPQVIASPSLIE